MSQISRFSSRRQRIDHAFLSAKLQGARSYRRIAGYFRSSIFELVGEEIAAIPKVQIVCNSELDAADVAIPRTPYLFRRATPIHAWAKRPARPQSGAGGQRSN